MNTRRILLQHAEVVHGDGILRRDIEIEDERIRALHEPNSFVPGPDYEVISLKGRYVLPGLIDDQVHFREPGLTHKGCIRTESAAAVAGGITSFMEMPNVFPPTLDMEKLEEKMRIAAADSLANYSFYLGASNDNLETVLAADPSRFCGLKIFMGSSTGNMLVDNEAVLRELFRSFKGIIALHCEDEDEIRKQSALFQEKYGDEVPVSAHPLIRNHRACFLSTEKAVRLAEETGARIHVLHISTAEETKLFSAENIDKKQITSEACVHHLWFTDQDYVQKGSLIKWNPAVKTERDREAIWEALHAGRIDIIATDHAPHTLREKQKKYFQCPSGGPLVQHLLPALAEMVHRGKCTLPFIVEKCCHNPARRFSIRDRGYIRPGFFADLVVLNMNAEMQVNRESLLYQCGWSPFEEEIFHSRVEQTWVNGQLVWDGEKVNQAVRGQRLSFS